MKKILLALFLGLILIVATAVWFYINAQPVSSNKDFKNFLINKGSSAGQIGIKLQEAGLIKNSIAFKIYTQFSGLSGKVQAGEYRLSPNFNLFQMVGQLTRGPLELWVTIPEGLRREEIATRFATGLERDHAFTNEFLQASKGEEGMLFPDTYLFPKDASASAVVNKMVRTFDAKTSGLLAGPDLNFNQRVTLASIIERETKTDTERPVVAGILINRIKAGMPLQVDATVQYAVGTHADWWPILSLEDLKIKSPFNTYKFVGLPPTPIANPGLSSLKAAFNPTQSDYWYYIHDKDGHIHFAKTLEEQNANISRYLNR